MRLASATIPFHLHTTCWRASLSPSGTRETAEGHAAGAKQALTLWNHRPLRRALHEPFWLCGHREAGLGPKWDHLCVCQLGAVVPPALQVWPVGWEAPGQPWRTRWGGGGVLCMLQHQAASPSLPRVLRSLPGPWDGVVPPELQLQEADRVLTAEYLC